MQAYKLTVTISDQRIVKLPDDIPPGPAEVIVLVGAGRTSPAGEEAPMKNEALFRVLSALRTSEYPRRSKEDIDAELALEHASWEDRG